MKVRKIWIAVLCVVIGVVWWVVRPQSLVHVAGIADKAEQITRYSISAVDDDVEQCWVTEPEDMQEIWKALETSKVTFVPKSAAIRSCITCGFTRARNRWQSLAFWMMDGYWGIPGNIVTKEKIPRHGPRC